MAKREKLGKYVLLGEIGRSGWGTEYRAAKLGSAGLESIVAVTRLTPSLSSQPQAVTRLMEQFKHAAQLHNPNITRILGIGKVDGGYYVCSEFTEGKSLGATFARCRQEGFPLSPDHALLIASKVCSALEHAHGRKGADGQRYFHGLLSPSSVWISYEGEVRMRGFGVWPGGAQDAGLMTEEEVCYLSPEQVAGQAGDSRSDVFALGALLFEALTGTRLFEGRSRGDVTERLSQARLQSPVGEDDSLPRSIREILSRALAVEAERRYSETPELRKALDAQIFSGDFTPTTFNLAFFMHSLFREDVERDSKVLEEERTASYAEYLMAPEEAPPPATPQPARIEQKAAPAMPQAPRVEREAARAVRAEAAPQEPPRVASPPRLAPPEPPEAPAVRARTDTGHGLTPAPLAPRSRLPLLASVVAVVVIALVAGGIFFGLGRRSSTAVSPPPSTLSAKVAAALAKGRELEAKLAALEAEQEAAQAAAAEDAKQELEAKAKASGVEVDPEAVAQAQQEARRKAEAEQAKRFEEERRRIEEERRKLEEERQRLEAERQAEEARLAEEKRKAEEARLAEEKRKAEKARLAREARLAATPAPTPPPRTPPPVRKGALVDVADDGVVPPAVAKSPRLRYPRAALREEVEGVVELSALIDERGNVVEVEVVKPAGGDAGLTEAAVDNVKKRKYRPATKDGVPVKVRLPVAVRFKLLDE